MTVPGADSRAPAGRLKFALALFLAVAASVASGQRPNPILDPEQRWAFTGFTLQPPRARGWFSLVKTREVAALVRRTETLGHTVDASVVSVRIADLPPTREAFLALTRDRRGVRGNANLDVTVREEVLEPSANVWCTRYRLAGQELVPGREDRLEFEIVGRTCLHPEARNLVVDVSFRERAPIGSKEPEYRQERDAFLGSLQFVPLEPPPEVRYAETLMTQGNAAEAVRVLVQLADRDGEPTAALRLAWLYDRGQGVERDPYLAERWYRIAARRGDVDALYNLGVLFEKAPAERRDVGEAVKWFRRAADQRDAQAQLNLGLLHYRGDGVIRDRRQARIWLELAADNGSERARALLTELEF